MKTLGASALHAAGIFTAGAMSLGIAQAGALTPSELALDQSILTNFNQVVFGSLMVNSSETQGRAAIGGGFSDNTANFCFQNCAGNTPLTVAGTNYSFGGFNAYGSAAGGSALNVNGGSNLYVGGSLSGTAVDLHNSGGSANVAGNNSAAIKGANLFYGGSNTGSVEAGHTANHVSTATAFPLPSFAAAFQTPLTDLSNALAVLRPTRRWAPVRLRMHSSTRPRRIHSMAKLMTSSTQP